MPKDTKTLGNSKARACESPGFVHKKGCARVLTQPHSFLLQCFYDVLHISGQVFPVFAFHKHLHLLQFF